MGVTAWASEQADPIASCTQFHRVLSEVSLQVSAWDLLQAVALAPNFRKTVQIFDNRCSSLKADTRSASTNTEPVVIASRNHSSQLRSSTSSSCGTDAEDIEVASDRRRIHSSEVVP